MSIFIDQTWIQGNGTKFSSINPANGEMVWEGYAANEAEVKLAIKAAKKAFRSWSLLDLNERKEYLLRFKQIITESKEILAEIISKETGKALWDSRNEVASMAAKVDISIQAHEERCHEMSKKQPNALSITRFRPHGAVAVFGPYNFPGHLPNGHIVPALLAGNTVIFKPSELTPLTAEFTIKCWEKAGLPKGVINLLQGGRETGRLLSSQEEIDGLFFTGSWNTGKIFLEQFATRPEKILALEMGGNNPLIFASANDIKGAAYAAVQSAFLSSGQRCTCARRLIVIEGNKGDEFIDTLCSMAKTIRVGPYTEKPEPFMGPVISSQAALNILSQQAKLQEKGGKPLLESKLLKQNTGLLSPGIMDATNIQQRTDEEIFGPLLQIIRVPSLEKALCEANNTAYGLSAGLLSEKQEDFHYFYNHIRAGIVNWNVQITGASSAAPFGGVGRSGNHRPSAYLAADYCSYPVATMESEEVKLPETITPGISI